MHKETLFFLTLFMFFFSNLSFSLLPTLNAAKSKAILLHAHL